MAEHEADGGLPEDRLLSDAIFVRVAELYMSEGNKASALTACNGALGLFKDAPPAIAHLYLKEFTRAKELKKNLD